MTDLYPEDDINLRGYWRLLVRRRVLILGTVFSVAIITAMITLLLPNVYQSMATLMPLGQSSNRLQNALGDLGGLLSLGSVGNESPTERLLAILRSRTLVENIIKRLDLLPRLFADAWDHEKQEWRTDEPPTLQNAVEALRATVFITTDTTTGILRIAVENTNPKLAARIANQYVDELQRALNENAFSLAKKNRLFIEHQLQKTRKSLEGAEEALRAFEQKHDIVALDAQTQAAVNALANLEGQIMAKEVQLGVLQRTRTGASPEVYLLREELRGLREQRTLLQHGKPEQHIAMQHEASPIKTQLSLDKAPEIKLQYVRLQRNALVQNKLFTLFAQQLEQARIDEARDETAFQLLDRAIPSALDRKIRPKRRVIVILAAMASFFLAVFLAFLYEYMDTSVRDQEQVERLTGTVVLATLPLPPAPRRRFWQWRARTAKMDLILHHTESTPQVEALRFLHTRLRHLNAGQNARSLIFTSAEPNENSSMGLVNLAIVAASAGEKVLLIDSDLHQPILHRILSCSPAPGLTELLADPEGLTKGICSTQIDALDLMPAGAVTSLTSAALEGAAFDTILSRCQTTYDLILCTAPPVLDSTDAVVLGSKVDDVCVVLTSGITQIEAVREARATLEAVQAKVIGAVLITDSSKNTA